MKSYGKLSIIYCLLSVLFVSCDLLEPENDNHSTLDRVYEDPSFAEGLLLRGYVAVPTNDYKYDEVATDDAVSNVRTNAYLRMATGSWSAIVNAESVWNNCNEGILYVNHFLNIVDEVPFKPSNETLNMLYKRRFTGEAYAIRGLLKYFLLRHHGGIGSNGELLGIPIYNKFLSSKEDFAQPRTSFAESVKSAYDDFDRAMQLLPMDYKNLASVADLPDAYKDIQDIANYNTVCGNVVRQRLSGRIVQAFRARLALLAASPAFNTSNTSSLWEMAAKESASLLNSIGGVNGLDPKGHLFYLKEQVDNANLNSGDNADLPEVIWRKRYVSETVKEANNFPPSLYGSGQINPSQNLIDAFPMRNGYPIADVANSAYNASNPYEGRDPRLAQYIVYNGSSLRGSVINTGINSGVNGLDASQTSTRTGYYLKKLLREDVNVNPASTSSQNHIDVYIRYTEIFLNFAEAANEVWGPDGGTYGYTARSVIGAIRKRAGITQPDAFLASITSKDAMRQLIRNERRLELCFEGYRFWDMRRWKENLIEAARGVRISQGVYTYFTVEERAYADYMYYGPIPNTEVVKFGLIQNQGW